MHGLCMRELGWGKRVRGGTVDCCSRQLSRNWLDSFFFLPLIDLEMPGTADFLGQDVSEFLHKGGAYLWYRVSTWGYI